MFPGRFVGVPNDRGGVVLDRVEPRTASDGVVRGSREPCTAGVASARARSVPQPYGLDEFRLRHCAVRAVMVTGAGYEYV